MLRVKCVGSALEVWYNPAGTPGAATLSATDGDIGWGGVALSGWDALFDNLKVGYDADDDDDLDGSDDVVLDEDFAAATVSPTHDDAGNLTKDADYAYVFDAWNNLVKVKAQNDADVVVGVYAYYADNRRASKTVTNRGALDGTTYFFYDGLREIEERNGSEAVTQQYVWGHEYLDQLLMIRGAGGTWFVHQAEADQGGRARDWNVIALTTPSGDVAEEVQYQPYGLPLVKRHLAFGDSDADGDVDSARRDRPGAEQGRGQPGADHHRGGRGPRRVQPPVYSSPLKNSRSALVMPVLLGDIRVPEGRATLFNGLIALPASCMIWRSGCGLPLWTGGGIGGA